METTPASQKVNKDVKITVTAINGGDSLMASGWDQPTGVTVTGPDGAEITMNPKGSGVWEGTYCIPKNTPLGNIAFTASVSDPTGNYDDPAAVSAQVNVTGKGAVTVKLEAPANLTYGDDTEITASVAKDDEKDPDALTGTVQFFLDSKDETHKLGAAQDISKPLSVTLDRTKLTAGEHTIYAVYSGSDYFAESEVSQTIDVAPLKLGWDASDLTASKKQDGTTAPATIWGSLQITGVLEGDDAAFVYDAADLTAGAFPSMEPGDYEVPLALAGENHLIGEDAKNYILTPPTEITASIYAVNTVELPEEDRRLEVEQGISSVTQDLIEKEFDTPNKIVEELSRILLEAQGGAKNRVFYDVTLQILKNGAWVDATEDDFPQGGLTITLPYPEETNQNGYHFTVVHMFENTSDKLGTTAGDTETPEVINTGNGIQFTVRGLSPIGVSWTKKSEGGGGGGGSSRPTYRPDVEDAENGDVTVQPGNPHKGDEVIVTPKPKDGYEAEDVIVTDKDGKPVDVTDNGDGTWTFTQPDSTVTVEAVFRKIPPEPLPFTDVPESAWYYDAVRYVYENGLMNGTSATTFSPDGTTTRGQIVTILWRMEGSPVVNYLMDFEDVDPDAYYGEAIRWAAGEGLAGGYGNGRFGPDDLITREQFAVVLYRYAQEQGYDVTVSADLSGYADAGSISGYALAALQWANAEGIVGDTGDITLTPQGQATRAQASVMLTRFCERYAL